MGVFFYIFVYNVNEDMRTQPIDLVIAYVNNKDKVWVDTYIKYCQTHNLYNRIVDLYGSRFGGLTYIYYHLKLASKNMPWINNIYLLLSNEEQIDKSKLPSNVKIVLHKDFIWHNFLPTFNSTTIEMFLWNIPNLSEHFIYANDDMLPTGKLEPSDFFDFKTNKIKISWRDDEFSFNGNTYASQCHNNCVSLTKALNIDFANNRLLRPVHSYTPMIKSHCESAFELIKADILPHIRVFRTHYQHNQYIYTLYEYFKFGTLESPIDFLYTELDKDFDLNHQICCINCENNKKYINQFTTEIEKLCE